MTAATAIEKFGCDHLPTWTAEQCVLGVDVVEADFAFSARADLVERQTCERAGGGCAVVLYEGNAHGVKKVAGCFTNFLENLHVERRLLIARRSRGDADEIHAGWIVNEAELRAVDRLGAGAELHDEVDGLAFVVTLRVRKRAAGTVDRQCRVHNTLAETSIAAALRDSAGRGDAVLVGRTGQ